MWVLKVEPFGIATPKLITGTLKSMQELVGGFIETVTLSNGYIIVCDESGRLAGKPKNIFDFRGTIFFCKEKGDAFTGLDSEDMRYLSEKIVRVVKMEKVKEEVVRKQLSHYGALQAVEPSDICPRCGQPTMDKRLSKNALSRNADIYICPQCGMEEALEALPGNSKKPLESWYIMRGGRRW